MAMSMRALAALGAVATLATGCTWWTRANVASTGNVMSEPEEFHAELSADGRYVAFHTLWSLDPADGPATDIYRRDLRTGQVELASRGDDSNPTVGDQASYSPSISADGRYVAFESYSDNLVVGDGNDAVDIFVRDFTSGTTTRVSIDSAGNEASASSGNAEISADGRYVVFTSFADDLVPDDDNNDTDVFRHDLATGETIRVSGPAGAHPGGGYRPAVSADGNLVLYEGPPTAVSGLVGSTNVLVIADIAAGTTQPAVFDDNGNALRGGRPHDLSGDGRHVVVISHAVLVYDVLTDELRRIDKGADGEPMGRPDSAAISDNGRFVVFDSFPSGGAAGGQTFVHDLATGETTMLAPTDDWISGGNEGNFPAISADGRTIAFEGLGETAQSPWGPYDLFVMANPTPEVETVVPATVGLGSTELVVTGHGFLDDTRLLTNDPNVTITVDAMSGGAELTATVTVGPEATGGPLAVVIWNPGTGAGSGSSTTCGGCLSVSP